LPISRVDEITKYCGVSVINRIKPSEWAVNREIKGTLCTLQERKGTQKTTK
jgi:hypothetical protein